MLNKYYITLVAGTRINGMNKAGSDIELSQHELHVNELRAELGERFISYFNSTGFIEAELTNEQKLSYEKDYRIYRISSIKTASLCPIKNFYTEPLNQDLWHLSLMSNQIYNSNRKLCGFNFETQTRTYGYITYNDYYILNEKLILNSSVNKYWKNRLYNIEYNMTDTGIVVLDLSDNPFGNGTFDFSNEEQDVFFGYSLVMSKFVISYSCSEELLLLGIMKLKLIKHSAILYYGSINGKFSIESLNFIEGEDARYLSSTGEGVEIIVADTHIDYNLVEFEDRASLLYNPYNLIFNDAYRGELDSGYASHGTLVASNTAGKTYGIAPRAKILGVTLFDYSEGEDMYGGSVNPSDKVGDGLSFIVGYVQSKKALGNNSPTVVNLSIKMNTSEEIDDMIKAMIHDGACVVIAAGNDSVISMHSPYDEDAILVAACDKNLIPSSFTEYGPRVSLYAPGEDIISLKTGGIVTNWSGTSAACPIAAGLCALYLSVNNNATQLEVKQAIVNNAVAAITYNRIYTVNLLAQNPIYCSSNIDTFISSRLWSKLILTVKPYVENFDLTNFYGDTIELTIDTITSAIVSASRLESASVATEFKLQP